MDGTSSLVALRRKGWSGVVDASVDAKRTFRQVAVYSQRPDHPIIAGQPETEYLRGYAFEVMASW